MKTFGGTLIVIAVFAFSSCGGGEEEVTLAQDDLATCIAIDGGPIDETTSDDEDSGYSGPLVERFAEEGLSDGKGYFAAWARDGESEQFPDAAQTDFVFFADPAAAKRAVTYARDRIKVPTPAQAQRHGNLVIFYGDSATGNQAAYIESCLDKADAGSGEKTLLVTKQKQQRIQRIEQRIEQEEQAYYKKPANLMSALSSNYERCLSSEELAEGLFDGTERVPVSGSDETGGESLAYAPVLGKELEDGRKAKVGNVRAYTPEPPRFDDYIFIDEATAAANEQPLLKESRGELGSAARAERDGQFLVIGGKKLTDEVIGELRGCYEEAVKETKRDAGG